MTASDRTHVIGGRWAPTHQHRKGGLYRLLGAAVWEPDRSDVVIYDDVEGTVWVRPVAEFDDGRFIPLEPPQRQAAPQRGALRRWLGMR